MSNNPWAHALSHAIKHAVMENEKKNHTMSKAWEGAAAKVKQIEKAAYVPVPRSLPRAGEGEALDVPTYQQLNKYNCGLVAAISLIRTFHPEWDRRDELVADIDTTSDEGTSTPEVLRQLKKHGVGTTKARGALTREKIARAIDGGFPVLTSAVLLDSDTDGNPMTTHWVVIYGYTHDHEYVYVANSSWGAFRSAQKIRWVEFDSKLVSSDHPHAAFWTCHGLIPVEIKTRL